MIVMLRRLRRRRRLGEELEHVAVAHALLQVVRAGAQVAALAGQRRPQLEEEARGDHAVLGQQVADLAGARMRRDRHRRRCPCGEPWNGWNSSTRNQISAAASDQREQRRDPSDPRVPVGGRVRARGAPARARAACALRWLIGACRSRAGPAASSSRLVPSGPTRVVVGSSPARDRRRPRLARLASARVAPRAGRPAGKPAASRRAASRSGAPLALAPCARAQPASPRAGAPRPASLEQVRGRARVLAGTPRALGQPRREALVVELDRDRQRSLQARRRTRASRWSGPSRRPTATAAAPPPPARPELATSARSRRESAPRGRRARPARAAWRARRWGR